jgi:hypothetical protein
VVVGYVLFRRGMDRDSRDNLDTAASPAGAATAAADGDT